MDIWITRAGKVCECAAHCGKEIKAGEPIVRGKIWRKKDGDTKRFSTTLQWHIYNANGECCWLIAGLAELEKTPYVETRGRKSLDLSEEHRTERNKLLRQHASVMQRLRFEKSLPAHAVNIEKVVKLCDDLEKIKVKITQYGGIPEGW